MAEYIVRQGKPSKELGERLLGLREKIVSHFTSSDWEEISFLSGLSDIIDEHPRLLRSLAWGDEDYSGNVLSVLRAMAERAPSSLSLIDNLLEKKHPTKSHYISAKPSAKKLTFAPHVFEVQEIIIEQDLVAVMMPFGAEFKPIHNAIKVACKEANLRCLRADDIWEESTIIQDIFNLLLKARIVVVDFTSRNANVMYETGIAHTLGKLVIPITQSLKDIPFDMAHHRALEYLPNEQGYADLQTKLQSKLKQMSA